MKKRAIRSECTMRKSGGGVRIYHEKKSDGVKGEHKKKSDTVSAL